MNRPPQLHIKSMGIPGVESQATAFITKSEALAADFVMSADPRRERHRSARRVVRRSDGTDATDARRRWRHAEAARPGLGSLSVARQCLQVRLFPPSVRSSRFLRRPGAKHRAWKISLASANRSSCPPGPWHVNVGCAGSSPLHRLSHKLQGYGLLLTTLKQRDRGVSLPDAPEDRR